MNRLRYAVVAVVVLGLLLIGSPAHAQTPESSRQVTTTVTVMRGDWLSRIAQARCGKANLWHDLYQDNKAVIGGNPNLIYPGQKLKVDCVATAHPVKPRPVKKATRSTARTSATGWVHPLPGHACVSGWGDPRGDHSHKGIDLTAGYGVKIRAAAAGQVTVVKWDDGGGWYVMLDNGRYLTVYMHMRSKSFLRVGQKVKAGQTIGYVGSTGDSSGPHLHFEVHTSPWHQINPAPFLRAHGVRVGGC